MRKFLFSFEGKICPWKVHRLGETERFWTYTIILFLFYDAKNDYFKIFDFCTCVCLRKTARKIFISGKMKFSDATLPYSSCTIPPNYFHEKVFSFSTTIFTYTNRTFPSSVGIFIFTFNQLFPNFLKFKIMFRENGKIFSCTMRKSASFNIENHKLSGKTEFSRTLQCNYVCSFAKGNFHFSIF